MSTQVGQVVDSAADFYSSRVPRKERKKTLVDELMADAQFQNYNKRKYAEIITAQQATAARGAHRHAKRLKGRKKWSPLLHLSTSYCFSE